MKKVLLLLLIVSAISCTKERDPSVIGKWNIVESYNDVGQTTYNNSKATFIKFYSNGVFEMDTISNYFAYKLYLNGMSKYKVLSDEQLRFYSADYRDSILVGYSLDNSCFSDLAMWLKNS